MNSFMIALRLVPGTRVLMLAVLLAAGLLSLGTARRSLVWQTLHTLSGGVIPSRSPFSLGALVTGKPALSPSALPPPASAPLNPLSPVSSAVSSGQSPDDTRRRLLDRIKADPALRAERATQLRQVCQEQGGSPSACDRATRYVGTLTDITKAYPSAIPSSALVAGDIVLRTPIWVGALVVRPAAPVGKDILRLAGSAAEQPANFEARAIR